MRRGTVLLLLLLSTACRRSSATADPPAAASGSAAAPQSSTQALALAKPAGSSPIDQQITQRQGIIQKAPAAADWVTMGQLWVREARETGDPGYYLNANACADLALHKAPDDRLALDLRAIVLLNQHRFEEARALSQKIVDGTPDDPTAYGNLSDALLELGRFEEAAAAVQKMVDLKPNLPSYSRAAYIRWLQGDDGGAKSVVRLAIDSGHDAHDPEPLAWVTVQAAMIFWNEGDYDGADAGFDQALAVFPDYPAALVGKGRIALAKGDGARAAELLTKAYAASPLVETSWLLGDARTMAGDAAGAQKAYADVERGGKLGDPRTLSLFYSTKDREPKAALSLAEEERKVRGDVATDDAVAWALHRNGRFAEAKTAIDQALRHGTKDARLLYHAGAIRIALGEVDEGKKRVKEALALNPKFDATAAGEATKLLAGAADKTTAP